MKNRRASLLTDLSGVLSLDNAINVYLVVTSARRGARIELYEEMGSNHKPSPKNLLKYANIVTRVIEIVNRYKPSKFTFVHGRYIEPFFTSFEVAQSKDMAIAIVSPYDESSYEAYVATGRVLDYETLSRRTFHVVYKPTLKDDGLPKFDAANARNISASVNGKIVWQIGYMTDSSDTTHIDLMHKRIVKSFRGIKGYSFKKEHCT